MGGIVKAITGGGGSPAPAPLPAAPTAADATNTSPAVTAQASAQLGRASNIGDSDQGPSLSTSSDDQYSVRKKLLGS